MIFDIYGIFTYLYWAIPTICWFIAIVILTVKKPCKAAYLMMFSACLVLSTSVGSLSMSLSWQFMEAFLIDNYMLFEIINWTYNFAALGTAIGLLLYVNMLNDEWLAAREVI